MESAPPVTGVIAVARHPRARSLVFFFFFKSFPNAHACTNKHTRKFHFLLVHQPSDFNWKDEEICWSPRLGVYWAPARWPETHAGGLSCRWCENIYPSTPRIAVQAQQVEDLELSSGGEQLEPASKTLQNSEHRVQSSDETLLVPTSICMTVTCCHANDCGFNKVSCTDFRGLHPQSYCSSMLKST